MYDFNQETLKNKISFFIEKYKALKKENNNNWDIVIKWSRDLKNKFTQNKMPQFDVTFIKKVHYRPFSIKFHYADKILSDVLTRNHYLLFGENLEVTNPTITIHNHAQLAKFSVFSSKILTDAGFAGRGTPIFTLYYYENNERKENITDWALTLFRNHVENSTVAPKKKGKKAVETAAKTIEKIDIFHYVYSVLHNPEYRKKYEQNLKRDFPRIPLYADFWKWAEIGKKLMDLHLNFETVEKWDLGREEVKLKNPDAMPKAKLKADKTVGKIFIDDITTLTGIPAQAWEYKLGNRSALEWILDQYKESTPSDPTIAAQFNTYKFADYKEQVIDLLMRVCRVSVETMQILAEMGED